MTAPGCATLHITNAYHPTSGGVRTFYHALLREAARQERRMALVVPGPEDRTEHLSETTTIYSVRAIASPVFDRRYRLLLPTEYLLPWRRRIRTILEYERPALVEINDKFALCYLAGVLRKGWLVGGSRPTLVGHSAERIDDSLRAQAGEAVPGLRFASWYMKWVYAPLFDYHVANSEYTADEIAQALPQWRRDHLSWLPMGVDTGTFTPRRRDERCRRELLAQAGGSPNSVLLVFSGRLSTEKNVAALVGMMAVLAQSRPDYRLVVAGEGPEMAAMQDQAHREAPGRVLLLGHVSPAASLARLIASADLFVHPNAREPFGIAPLEAMAAGTPIVVPTTGGVRSYACPRTAWLAEPTAEGLAHAVEDALAHEGPRRHRAMRARQQALDLDWHLVADQWFSRYDDLCERGCHEWSAAGYTIRGVGLAGA